MNKNLIALYPGTFDPVTYGHLDIIERASLLFNKVIVAIANNPSKIPLFTLKERKHMLELSVKKYKNVEIDWFNGLLVKYARKKNVSLIIRGLRAVSDFEYEFQMSLTNRKLAPEITTIYMMPNEKYTYLNSSLVRELMRLDADVTEFVPDFVIETFKRKLKKI
ncbi:MAG: pantetheine-phosphate adenylyltransferase [Ignavibacteria bacterium]|nr:pantetheine-phosphate adenylyltransferase [Ignavibacteria bacterium]